MEKLIHIGIAALVLAVLIELAFEVSKRINKNNKL